MPSDEKYAVCFGKIDIFKDEVGKNVGWKKQAYRAESLRGQAAILKCTLRKWPYCMKTVQPTVFRVWSRLKNCKTCLCFLTFWHWKFFAQLSTHSHKTNDNYGCADSFVNLTKNCNKIWRKRCCNVRCSQVQNCLHRVLCTYYTCRMTATYHLLAKLMLKCKRIILGVNLCSGLTIWTSF